MSLTWLLGAFLAFVKAPGGPHCPTAVLLLGKARERFATLQSGVKRGVVSRVQTAQPQSWGPSQPLYKQLP